MTIGIIVTVFESPGYLNLRPELTQMFVFARRNNVNASYSHRKTRAKYKKITAEVMQPSPTRTSVYPIVHEKGWKMSLN